MQLLRNLVDNLRPSHGAQGGPWGARVRDVPAPRYHKYRRFNFVIIDPDGLEHNEVIQADYTDQVTLNALTETWGKGQASRLFPQAAKHTLIEVRDFADLIK